MVLSAFVLVVAASAPQQQVSVDSGLGSMTDLTRLVYRADYRAYQASSYDRASVAENKEGWFANEDWGKYIRTETTSGRAENVMAEMSGPGMINRIWSANPVGTLRIYLDGSPTPVIEGDMAKLLRGQGMFPPELAYESSKGCNLYYPIPFAKSAKVTLEGPDSNRVYYHVGWHRYRPGASVASFAKGDGSKSVAFMTLPAAEVERKALPAGRSRLVGATGEGLYVWQVQFSVARQPGSDMADWGSLRALRVEVTVDGEKTMDVPLADLFTTLLKPYDFATLASSAKVDSRDKDGNATAVTFLLNLPMPFTNDITLNVTNTGTEAVDLGTHLSVARLSKPADYRLYAQFKQYRGQSRPFRDLQFLKASGAGRYVGTSMTVENPTDAWWGEGDEKIFIDGDPEPNYIGTGTEDYFGYAWCWPAPFMRPFHAQTVCDGPGNFGNTGVLRWHLFDDIPFTTAIDFRIELWHWANVDFSTGMVSFWYGEPGKTKVGSDPAPMNRKLIPNPPVKGAIEGEGLKILKVTGGKTENQGGFFSLSSGKQLWWQDAKPGDTLQLEVDVPRTGRYKVAGHFCHAQDYGIHSLDLGGHDLGTHDFYGIGVAWNLIELGTVELPAGKTTLTVKCIDSNLKAQPRQMFGLDYLRLDAIGDETRNAGVE